MSKKQSPPKTPKAKRPYSTDGLSLRARLLCKRMWMSPTMNPSVQAKTRYLEIRRGPETVPDATFESVKELTEEGQ